MIILDNCANVITIKGENMNTREMAEKYSVSRSELETFLLNSELKYKMTMLNGMIVLEDPDMVIEQFNLYLDNSRIEAEKIEKERKKEEEQERLKKIPYQINEDKRDTVNLIRMKARKRAEEDLIYSVIGARGRRIKIYPYKCVITTDVTLGSVLTNNATDGEKTIYYKDCIGVQYKRPGATIGYLQLETAAGTMNNEKSNAFNENSFTFEKNTELMDEIYEYIIGIMDEIKAL